MGWGAWNKEEKRKTRGVRMKRDRKKKRDRENRRVRERKEEGGGHQCVTGEGEDEERQVPDLFALTSEADLMVAKRSRFL